MITRRYGVAPAAFESYVKACGAAGVDPNRISQTIGTAKASAGFHKQDGTLVVGGKKIPYCAATDIGDNGLSKAKIRRLLDEMAKRTFAGFFRDWSGNSHIHAVFAGVSMKPELFLQVLDFLNDRNGLTSHEKEYFYTAPPEYDRGIARALKQANPVLWGIHEHKIPKAYRIDEPPRLFVNGKKVSGAYLTGGAWHCMESSLAAILGATTQTPALIAPVAALVKRWGFVNEKYTANFAAQNRADIRVK